MYLSDRNDRYVDLWYIFCVKFSLKKVVDPHVQALSFTLFQFFRLKERQINIGRIDLRPGETTSRETLCYHFKNDKYGTHQTNRLKSGRTVAGWVDFWAKRTDTYQIILCYNPPPPPPPSHTIVSIESNPFIFFLGYWQVLNPFGT